MYLILGISPPLPVFLEKEMATHSSTIAWKIPWIEEPGRLQCMESQRVGHDWATSLSFPCVLRAWSLLSRGIHMAASEIHWDSKETFCLALPTLREISHKGSQPIRVLCHLNLLFTFLYYFWKQTFHILWRLRPLHLLVVAPPFIFGLGGSSLQLFVASWNCPLVAVCGLLIAAGSLVA